QTLLTQGGQSRASSDRSRGLGGRMEASPCLGPGEGTGRLRRPDAAWPGVFVGEPVTSATLRLETRRWHSASVGDAVKKRSVAGSAGRGGGVLQGRAGAPR